jgi:hypothetical protein
VAPRTSRMTGVRQFLPQIFVGHMDDRILARCVRGRKLRPLGIRIRPMEAFFSKNGSVLARTVEYFRFEEKSV